MVSAREVRATVRAELAEQLKVRQDTALSVAAAWARLEKAREKLAAAEREVGSAVVTGSMSVPLPQLATLTGIPVADLRRLSRVQPRNAG